MYVFDIAKLSDHELIQERDKLNFRLKSDFFANSGLYDATATALRELEGEILKREKEGPPWTVNDPNWECWPCNDGDAFDEVKGG